MADLQHLQTSPASCAVQNLLASFGLPFQHRHPFKQTLGPKFLGFGPAAFLGPTQTGRQAAHKNDHSPLQKADGSTADFFDNWAWVKTTPPGNGPQVLVHFFLNQGKPFWGYPIFDPPIQTRDPCRAAAGCPAPPARSWAPRRGRSAEWRCLRGGRRKRRAKAPN